MARTFTGQSLPTGYLSATLGSDLTFNADQLICFLVKPGVAKSDGWSNTIFSTGVGSRGSWVELEMQGTDRVLKFGQRGYSEQDSGFVFPEDVWSAGYVRPGHAAGIDTHFRMLRLDTGVLSNVTVVGYTLIAPLLTDAVTIGNLAALESSTYGFSGNIHSVTFGQGTHLTDDEFRSWAYTGRRPRDTKASWTIWGVSEESDETGNGVSLSITGPVPVADAAPQASRYGVDVPYMSAPSVRLPVGLTTRNVALGDARRNI